MQQQLRDKMNRLMATRRSGSGGRVELWDAQNRFLGYYDPKSNKTWDARNSLVGSGDLLMTLLKI